MSTRPLLLLAAVLALLPLAATAEAAEYVPGEVVVGHHDGTVSKVDTATGQSVGEAISKLRRHPEVAYAVPNYVAHAAQFTPNDPYLRKQWNFIGEYGIGMPEPRARRAAAAPPWRWSTAASPTRTTASSSATRTCTAPRSSTPGTSSAAMRT